MPNLVSVDVSVTGDRIRLVFSHRAVAAAYAAYLRALDLLPPRHQPIPGYQRSPQLHTTTKEVSLCLPDFITWFITCRLPDDEDSVTFTFMDADEGPAGRWAQSMVLFERVPATHEHEHDDNHDRHGGHDDSGAVKQLHVRRLWNKAHLLSHLEELRRLAAASSSSSPSSPRRSAGSPAFSGAGGAGGRIPVSVAFAGPGRQMQDRGDIWW
ncbi:hypothetical protein VTK56DRAFT_5755 [Thermocarpiscus australiensis]